MGRDQRIGFLVVTVWQPSYEKRTRTHVGRERHGVSIESVQKDFSTCKRTNPVHLRHTPYGPRPSKAGGFDLPVPDTAATEILMVLVAPVTVREKGLPDSGHRPRWEMSDDHRERWLLGLLTSGRWRVGNWGRAHRFQVRFRWIRIGRLLRIDRLPLGPGPTVLLRTVAATATLIPPNRSRTSVVHNRHRGSRGRRCHSGVWGLRFRC